MMAFTAYEWKKNSLRARYIDTQRLLLGRTDTVPPFLRSSCRNVLWSLRDCPLTCNHRETSQITVPSATSTCAYHLVWSALNFIVFLMLACPARSLTHRQSS